MEACEICNCKTFERYIIDTGDKVCGYCEQQYRDAKNVLYSKTERSSMQHNNIVWLIKQDYKTVLNWAKKHGFSANVVSLILNRHGMYTETNIHKMSKQHFNVIMALCDDGYTDVLINEEYITHV